MDKINNLILKTYVVLKNKKGQGMVEYGLIIAGIALVVVAAFVLLSNNLTTLFNTIGSKVNPPAQ